MKNYFKLVNFELSRFIKIYFILMVLTVISQIIGTVSATNNYLNHFNQAVYIDGGSTASFIEQYGLMSMRNVQVTGWFTLPIVFAAAALIFYSFMIWYRDWFGKNTFVYRLLMLPTARLNIYLSKATAIFLMVLGLVALQIILLLVEGNILKWMVPANLRMDYSSVLSMIGGTPGGLTLGLLIPPSFTEFLIHYGIGFMAIFALFTAILFERSYRMKGIIYGLLYFGLTMGLFLSPMFMVGIREYLYPLELFALMVVLWGVITAMSIWVSNYLMNKKITV